ncbi:carbonic anhydrase [Halomonas sp. WWR20]
MAKKFLGCSLLVAGLSGALPAFGAGSTSWSYAGEHGPSHWGALDPAFATCEAGSNQSPINLEGMLDGDLPALHVHYGAKSRKIVNNGHALQIDYPQGNAISLEGRRYSLKQAHFHTPSEHAVNGRRYPMEGHLVHADDDGNLAVIAVMFERGQEHAALADAWDQVPQQQGEALSLLEGIDATALLPDDRGYYRANGSLTTPPCTEGVRWLVMKQPVQASRAQMDSLAEAVGHPNNRPLQPLNARVIAR